MWVSITRNRTSMLLKGRCTLDLAKHASNPESRLYLAPVALAIIDCICASFDLICVGYQCQQRCQGQWPAITDQKESKQLNAMTYGLQATLLHWGWHDLEEKPFSPANCTITCIRHCVKLTTSLSQWCHCQAHYLVSNPPGFIHRLLILCSSEEISRFTAPVIYSSLAPVKKSADLQTAHFLGNCNQSDLIYQMVTVLPNVRTSIRQPVQSHRNDNWQGLRWFGQSQSYAAPFLSLHSLHTIFDCAFFLPAR